MAELRAFSESDVIEIVRAARDSRCTLELTGHGTKRGLGRPIECDDVLDLSGLNGIESYEPDELVITAGAGTPVVEIEAALATNNQRLGFEPADWGPLYGAHANAATIGGVLSADACGSAVIRYGRARDHLLGFRAVNGFGEACKAGGKVVKNVTGFDLPKLMCGAMGTLGVLTEVTLRAFPKPPRSETFAADNLSPEGGLSLLRLAWSSALEATGLAFRAGTAFIRLEGSRAGLNEKIAILRALCEDEPRQIDDGDAVFRGIASGDGFPASQDAIWRLHLPPSSAAELISELQPTAWCADWAGGLVWAACDSTCDVRAVARAFEARAILMRGGDGVPPFEPENAVRAELTRRVKAAFDPLRLFNPGRMWEGV